MAEKKKLQVFVSSTYIDLKTERQAAVEAILTAGHIPAGMELFTAGDESQLEVIKRWITESDIFLLILGGRYGSLEPHSGKSYVECEYDYAVSLGKPLFACIVKDEAQRERVKHYGLDIVEQENPGLLKAFRQKVTSKMCRFWEDTKDIKLTILETLSEFARREELSGWVRGHESVNAVALAAEVARLAKENTELRQKLSNLSISGTSHREEQYALAMQWDGKRRLRGFDLSHRDLSQLWFQEADLANANLYKAILKNSDLRSATLTRANLAGVDLGKADLRGARLSEADLAEANLRGAWYSRETTWPDGFDYQNCGAIGPHANLPGADLHGAKLDHPDLQGADLHGAHLQGANLERANLSGVNLYGASLQGANLQGANLSGAHLSGAHLQGANLQGANLQRADLQNAYLLHARLEGANLERTDLSRARLLGASYNKETIWPISFDYQNCSAIASP